jgi:hypothetical protein
MFGVYDGSGHMCGPYSSNPEFVDYPYLYFWMPYPGFLDKTTCMKECPEIGNHFREDNLDEDI